MVKGIMNELAKYYNVVAVLPHKSLRKVADIVEMVPEEQPYGVLKQRLQTSHQLTGFQPAEKLLQMPPLGSGKPSDLMAAILEVCPRGEEWSEFFACLGLQRLPREIWILLSEVDHEDPKTSCGAGTSRLLQSCRSWRTCQKRERE
jgi:hypothetical protein